MARDLAADGMSRKCRSGCAPDREDSHHDYSFNGERAAGPTAALFMCTKRLCDIATGVAIVATTSPCTTTAAPCHFLLHRDANSVRQDA